MNVSSSLGEVTARISQIQSNLARLEGRTTAPAAASTSPAAGTGAATGASGFQALLDGLGDSAAGGATGATYGTQSLGGSWGGSYGSWGGTAAGADAVQGAAQALGIDPSTVAGPGAGPASQLLSWAAAQVGTLERGSNLQPFAPMVGHANGAAWCATFATAAAANGGAALPQGANSASTVTQRSAFMAAGAWQDAPAGDPTSVARPGDLVYYRNRGTGAVVDHVGLVVGRTNDGKLVTVEGNTSGPGGQGVHYKLRSAADHIVGYGHPVYPRGGAVPAGWSVPRRMS